MALTPSHRVHLIKEIVRRLSAEEWQIIDITLRQFSLPWVDAWNGSKESYVGQMIEKGDDQVLEALAAHLGFVLQRAPDRMEPAFWRKGYFRLFLSHLAEFRKAAADLQEQLSAFGISAFVAHNDIAPSAEWQNEIESALATADGLLALLHPGFHASKWTDQEVGYAMGRNLTVFSVKLGEDPYGFIGRFQAFQGEGKSADALAAEIFEVMVKHKQTRRRVAEALLLRMEGSDDFAQAKANIALLERATYWDSTFPERLRQAVKDNGQVRQSWGVPERIERLIGARSGEGV